MKIFKKLYCEVYIQRQKRVDAYLQLNGAIAQYTQKFEKYDEIVSSYQNESTQLKTTLETKDRYLNINVEMMNTMNEEIEKLQEENRTQQETIN